ncbi:MAG: ribokinase [Erysipelotrichaceae bacterium]|nr:ribokinase [Erysipelotrichaceae bacterium]
MKKIVVIGSINVDLVATCDRFPKAGETLFGKDFAIYFGGKGANQAVCAAKLGADVTMIGCVGDDDHGKSAIANLDKFNINTKEIIKTKSPTGVALITVADHDNQIIVISGANKEVSCDMINEKISVIDNADLVMLQLEIPLNTVKMIVDHCHKKKIKVILNPAPYNDIAKELIDKVDYMTPNKIELESMFNMDHKKALALYPNKLIMTAGSEGVYYHDNDSLINVPAQKVDVVDTTGAGDTFNGALAVALTSGKSLRESIIFGQKAASVAIGKMGAQTAMPYLNEIK